MLSFTLQSRHTINNYHKYEFVQLA